MPRDLLVAIGYAETRLNNHDGEPSSANGYGLMHLVSNPGHLTLSEASAETGYSADQLKNDDAANIEVAAAATITRLPGPAMVGKA